MKAHYEIDSKRGLVIETFEGRVTLKALVPFFQGLYADPKWDPSYDGLADLTAATIDMDFDDMAKLVGYMRSSGSASRGRWAFVVGSALNLGMSRMFQTLSDDLQDDLRFFLDREDALRWLGRWGGSEVAVDEP
jgi:hypothetical protein